MTRINSRVYQGGELVDADLALPDLHKALRDPQKLVWIDYISPARDDLDWIANELKLHPIAITDALEHHTRPKLERYEHHLFFVGYEFSPLSSHTENDAQPADDDAPSVSDDAQQGTSTADFESHEIAVFVTRTVIVTVRREPTGIVERVEQLIDKHDAISRSGAFSILWALLDIMVDSQFDAVQDLDDVLDDLEARVFVQDRPNNDALQRDIFTVRKNLVVLRRLTLPMREIINSILRGDTVPVPKELQPFFSDAYDHTLRVNEWVDSQRDLVTSLLDANLTIQGNRMNLIMKKVTSWAAIIALPTAITGFFGQNVTFFGFGRPSGLLLSSLLIVSTTVLLYWQFKRNDWL